jgi:heme exporter protein C
MVTALLFGFLSFTLLAAVLLWARTRSHVASTRLAELEEEALELGLGEDA